jgi:glucose/arabinose dehydrogenase
MAERRIASVHGSIVLGALSALGILLGATAPALANTTLTGEAAAAFDAKVFVDGLDQPTDLVVLPDGRVIVIQKSGDVLTFPVGAADPVEDHIMVSTNSEQGLLGIVADPAFGTNNYIYVYSDSGPDGNNRHQVVRYKFGADNKLGTKTVVIDGMNLQAPANHDGGGIDVYKGDLYMSVGDTGANASPPTNRYGSCLNHGNGKVLRVSLADATLGQPPADNPLMNLAMVTGCDNQGGDYKMTAPDKRIWAWGFRNPFRMWIDKTTGKMWVGDVGESTREEITVAQMGKHHGYPFREGTKDWMQNFAPANECMGMTPASECIGPVFDYGHDGGNNCVMGGRILDGCDWPAAFKSRYIFADHGSGKVWTLDVNATRDGIMAGSQKDFANSHQVTGMRMGSDNALYILEEGPGVITRITAKGSTAMPGSCLAVNAEPGVSPGGGSGAGGAAAGGAGGAATAGAAAGGNNPGGGTPGSGGTTSNPGGGTTTNPTGGTTSNPTGGTTSNPSGGTTLGTAAGTAGSNGVDSGDSGGCGCQVVGAPSASVLGLGGLIAGLGMALRRRRGK